MLYEVITEDEPDLYEKLATILETEKYTVELAQDGVAALEKIWNENHDLILLDIMLPGKNGLEVLQEIRNEGVRTPVLMLTAKGDVEDNVITSYSIHYTKLYDDRGGQ